MPELPTHSHGTTSTSLLRRAQAGEPQSWECFVRLYAPLIFHWALQAGAQRSDTGDVVQDVFQAVAANLASFDPERGSLRGWLRTITRNKTFDLLRHGQGQARALGGTEAFQRLQDLPAELDTSSEHDLRVESRLLAQQALRLLESEFPQRSMDAFLQVVVEQRQVADVADSLQMTKAAVYMAKHRILKRLREVLDEPFDS